MFLDLLFIFVCLFCFSGTVIHPKATIFAVAGDIIIGSNNIIEEGAIIVNRCVLINHHLS